MGMARKRGQTGLNVIGVSMAQRTNQSQVVHDLGRAGQELADMYSRYARSDSPEFASGGRRTIRLGVPGFLLCGAAVKVKQNQRLGPAKRSFGTLLGLRPDSQQIGYPKGKR